MIEKIWDKIDLIAVIFMVIAGVLGYNLLAAAIAIFMAGYHTHKAHSG
jgi:hypothetical protein